MRLLVNYRLGRALRRQHKLAPADPIPLAVAREAGFLRPEDVEALRLNQPLEPPPAARKFDAGVEKESRPAGGGVAGDYT